MVAPYEAVSSAEEIESAKAKGDPVHPAPVHGHHRCRQGGNDPDPPARGLGSPRDVVRRLVGRGLHPDRRERPVPDAGHADLLRDPVATDGTAARVICDVFTPRGEPFAGDPRYVLRRQVERRQKLGYIVNMGPELEFFLFRRAEDGTIEPLPPRSGRLLRLLDRPRAGAIRHDMVDALEAFGIRGRGRPPRGRGGQHEIDFEYADALQTADNAITFKFTLKAIAQQHGLYATFMPKPIHGINGSGMHTHQSLYSIEPSGTPSPTRIDPYGLSDAREGRYMAGILTHARGHDRRPRAAREQLQAAGPGLRGTDVPDVGPDEPLGAHPGADGLAGQVDRGDARRGPLPRPVLEHLPRLRRDDRGRPRRRREGPRAARAGRGVALRDGRRDDRGQVDPRAAGNARRGARRAREGRR